MIGYVVVIGLVLAFVLPIFYFAGRSAKRGRRFRDRQDPIQEYDDEMDSRPISPWSSMLGFGQAGGWKWRVRAQLELDEERAAEREKKRRKQRQRRQ